MYLLDLVGQNPLLIFLVIALLIASIILCVILKKENQKYALQINQMQENDSDDEQISCDDKNKLMSEESKKVENSINETLELQNITKELEMIPKNKTITLTPYEAEQEEKAIISYDELIERSKNASICYSEKMVKDDVVVQKVDLDKTGQIELDPIKRELNSRVNVNVLNYDHEESFLETLKQLNSILN